MVKSLMYVILCLAYLFFLNARLVGVLLGGFAILTILSGGLRRVTSKLNNDYQAEKAKLAHISEEVFNNIRTVKAFHNV
jgi:ABC-type bacteriocin/lantibiotic exporter with double-glycine peptidase domain